MKIIRNTLLAIAAAACLMGAPGEAHAQGCGPTNPGCVVPNRPALDATNAAANTRFVGNALGALIVATAPITAPFAGGVYTIGCPTCVLISGTGKGDTNYSIASTDRYVYSNAPFTAARVWTLPPASSLAAGTTIWVEDAAGTVTTSNTLTVSRAGADTINTGSTSVPLTSAGNGAQFTTDGVSNWGTTVQSVSTGGTGRLTLTNHGVLIGAGANPITQLAAAAAGTLLTGQGAADPLFSATPTLGASGTPGSLTFGNASSGLLTVQPATGALGTVTVSIPAATDTLVNLASTQPLTNKTYNGLTITSSTGTLTVANGKTLTASNSLAFTGTDATSFAFPGASDTVAGVGTNNNWTGANTFLNPATAPGQRIQFDSSDANPLALNNQTLTLSNFNATNNNYVSVMFTSKDQAAGTERSGSGFVGVFQTRNAGVMVKSDLGFFTRSLNGTVNFPLYMSDTRLIFGSSISASFPAIIPSGTTAAFRLGDNSADAPISAAAGSFSGAVKSSSASGGVGYATGAGGTITQGAGSGKATAVTLSTASGAITMNNANLAAGTIVSFVLTNTSIAATDVLILNHISGGTIGSYTLNAQAAGGSATINVRNNTAGGLAEAIVIQFAIVKGVNSFLLKRDLDPASNDNAPAFVRAVA